MIIERTATEAGIELYNSLLASIVRTANLPKPKKVESQEVTTAIVVREKGVQNEKETNP